MPRGNKRDVVNWRCKVVARYRASSKLNLGDEFEKERVVRYLLCLCEDRGSNFVA